MELIQKIRPFFHSSWWEKLYPYLNTEEGIKPIRMYSEASRNKEYIRPAPRDLFNVYKRPFQSISTVIVGQDPYNTENHAHGYSFSTLYAPPYSLQIIMKEIFRTHFKQPGITMNDCFCCGDLRQWADQGVFLINRYLSVGKEPESHKEYGWQYLTNATIKLISDHSAKNVVFMLWGNKAKELAPLINPRHAILESHHPASERYGKSFIGNDIFLQADAELKKFDQRPVNWGVWPQYVESFEIFVGPDFHLYIPYYMKRYFVEAFGKDWREKLHLKREDSLSLIDKALAGLKFGRFQNDSKLLYMEKENFHKLLFLIKKELSKHDANQIFIE